MNRKLTSCHLAFIASLLSLAACAQAAPSHQPHPTPETTSTPSVIATQSNPTVTANPAQDAPRADSQGDVEFVVTPLNLAAPDRMISFEVAMNSQSVDLTWDLAALSVLKTDTGLEVSGLKWPVSSGRHFHGTLAFPAATVSGLAVLAGATTVTLTIRNAGANERVFVWPLS